MNLRKKREVVNMTNSVINNLEIDALEFIETARTEKKKMILSSLKRKPENVVNAGKRRKLHSRENSEYNESDGPEESDEEVIDITQDEEARNLTEDEVHIRNKLLDVLAANKDKDKQSGKIFMSSVPLNNIIDITDRETYKAIKSILNDDQLEWFKG
ncbi:2753_t:CDS:2, partial [Funneliformis geosporum]